MKDAEDFEAMEVQNGENISLIYYYKNIKQEELIQQHLQEVDEIVKQRPRLGMIEGVLLKKSPHWF